LHRVSSKGERGLLGRRLVAEEEVLPQIPARRRALVRMRGAELTPVLWYVVCEVVSGYVS
jgi:hypothetical protein